MRMAPRRGTVWLGAALVVAALAGIRPAAAEGVGFNPLEMRAQLSPHRYTTLSAEIGAKINSIALRDGQSFRSGDLLVEFDCTMNAAQLDKARAQLAATENTLQGQRKLAEHNAVGMVELKNSEAEVQKAKADVAYLRSMVSRCRVTAPFNGRVVEHKAREQQFVQPGQPLVEILDDTVLELEFLVPSRWLAWFKPGYSFRARIEDTSKEYPVRLVRTGARIDPVSQSVKAVAVIDGKYPELIAGMSGQILLVPPPEK